MSLLKWLKKSVVQQPGLPNPLDEVTVDRQNMVASTNEAVMDVMPAATTNSKTRAIIKFMMHHCVHALAITQHSMARRQLRVILNRN